MGGFVLSFPTKEKIPERFRKNGFADFATFFR